MFDQESSYRVSDLKRLLGFGSSVRFQVDLIRSVEAIEFSNDDAHLIESIIPRSPRLSHLMILLLQLVLDGMQLRI